MTIKEAAQITKGGLGEASKMPCRTYNTSPKHCPIGSQLRKRPGTVCSACYACKGRALFPSVANAWERHTNTWKHEDWTLAMITLIGRQSPEYFRWHSAGDLQSVEHLLRIFEIAWRLPNTRFWLPTKEIGIVRQALANHEKPPNLCIRVSSFFLGQAPMTNLPDGVCTSTVDSHVGHRCMGVEWGSCRDCRACWMVPNVDYPQH